MKTICNQFSTNNFYLAAYLISHGIDMANCEREHNGRATFIFPDTDNLRERVGEFTFGRNALVSAPSFINAIKRLKSLLYDGI
jgi:hypothetical protein